MSDTQIIGASIQVDAGNSIKTVKELREEVKQAKEQLESATIGSKDYEAAQGRLTKATDMLNSATSKGSGGIKAMAGEVANSIPGFSALEGGALKALKALGMLALTPVGLVLTAIAAVIALVKTAMDRSEESTNKIKVAFSAFSGVVNFVLKALEPLGKFLIDGIVKGLELAGKAAQETMKLVSGALSFLGFDKAAKAVNDFNEGMTESVKVARELAKAEAEHEAAQRKSRLTQLQYQKDAEKLRQIRDNENLTLAQRIKANEELSAVLKKQLQEELNIAQTALKVANLRIQQEGKTREALDAQAAAMTEIADIQERITGQESEQLQNRVNLQKEYAQKAEDARKEAAEKAKEAREKQRAFDEQLLKIQQENQLLQIKDSYEKERQALENKIAEDRRLNEQALKEGRLTKDQYNKIQKELDTQANLQRTQLTDKHNKEVADKEAAFQKELAALSTQIKLKGITDARELERVQLQQGYDEKLQDAMNRYKDDQEKLQQFKALLDEQLKQDQTKLEEKYLQEDNQKKVDLANKELAQILNNSDILLKLKREALEADVLATEEAYKRKEITEAQYLEKKKANTEAAKALDKEEAEGRKATIGTVSGALGNLATLAGKQTAAGKGLAIAQTSIETYQSAISAYKSLAPIPVVGPALGAVAAAAAVKNGLDAVKRITSVKVPGGDSGGGNVSAPAAPAAPIAPIQASTKIDATSADMIGNAAAGGVNKTPVRAYVLNADINNESERNTRLERAAQIGG